MNIVSKVKELGLPSSSYVVVGSGTLDVLGIRGSKDVDLVVSPEVYEKLKLEGWQEKSYDDGTSFLVSGIYEVALTWDDISNKPNLANLLQDAHIVDSIPFVNVKRLMGWKKRKGRDKDITDIELIKSYLEKKKV